MNLQRTLLRAMLWMLAAAAGAGILAVFLATEVMGRMAGTALVGAIAVGLAMPVSRLMDDEKRRPGGIVGLGSIVVAFALGLGAIWADLFQLGWDTDWRLALTSLLVCIGGLVAANMLAGRTLDRHWYARTAGLYADALGSAILAAAIWMDSHFASLLGQTGSLILASGLITSLCLVGLGTEHRPWRWAGVLAAGVGLILGLLGVWVVPSDDPTSYVATMCFGGVIAYAVVILSIPLGDARTWASIVSIGSAAATGACVSLLSFLTGGFDDSGPEGLTRVTGAAGIVAACSTLGVVILYRLNRRPASATAAPSEIAAVELVCPHCARRQSVAVGESACAGCGLLFTLKVSEPRCGKCEYPLLDLRGEVCPECGTRRGQVVG